MVMLCGARAIPDIGDLGAAEGLQNGGDQGMAGRFRDALRTDRGRLLIQGRRAVGARLKKYIVSKKLYSTWPGVRNKVVKH